MSSPFLEQAKKAPETLDLGENVVVIGGGNTAMDAARAAVRLPGVKRVSLVYRRTRRYMPADQEELELALADGGGIPGAARSRRGEGRRPHLP